MKSAWTSIGNDRNVWNIVIIGCTIRAIRWRGGGHRLRYLCRVMCAARCTCNDFRRTILFHLRAPVDIVSINGADRVRRALAERRVWKHELENTTGSFTRKIALKSGTFLNGLSLVKRKTRGSDRLDRNNRVPHRVCSTRSVDVVLCWSGFAPPVLRRLPVRFSNPVRPPVRFERLYNRPAVVRARPPLASDLLDPARKTALWSLFIIFQFSFPDQNIGQIMFVESYEDTRFYPRITLFPRTIQTET